MAENQHVIQTLGSNRPHPALCNGIRLWRFNRCSDLRDPKGSDPAIELSLMAPVTVMDETSWWIPVEITGLRHLLCQPPGRRVSGRSSMNDFPRAVIDHEEHIERPKPDRLNREEVAGPDLFGVLCEKSVPAP